MNDAVQAKHKARKKVAKFPTPVNRAELNKCTAKVRLITRKGKRTKWTKTCENLDLNKDGKKHGGFSKTLKVKEKKKTLNQS